MNIFSGVLLNYFWNYGLFLWSSFNPPPITVCNPFDLSTCRQYPTTDDDRYGSDLPNENKNDYLVATHARNEPDKLSLWFKKNPLPIGHTRWQIYRFVLKRRQFRDFRKNTKSCSFFFLSLVRSCVIVTFILFLWSHSHAIFAVVESESNPIRMFCLGRARTSDRGRFGSGRSVELFRSARSNPRFPIAFFFSLLAGIPKCESSAFI